MIEDMSVYPNSQALYTNLEVLFSTLQAQEPQAVEALARSRLAIRIRLSEPAALVAINGRAHPVEIKYGVDGMRPDLDIELSADSLHAILMGELSLKRALASGAMRVRGPVWKTSARGRILKRGKLLDTQILKIQSSL
jgi:putative sterol carrier protein